MSLDVFNALVQGYSDRLVDMQMLAAQAGFWSGYYQSKRPKRLSEVLKSISKAKLRNKKSTPAEITEEDVDAFVAKDRKFAEFLKQNGFE